MERHDLSGFDSGVPLLDDWLKRRARANQASGATRTFVACEREKVLAYYALAAGAVGIGEAPGHFRRNMPDPIPVAILARLAVDKRVQRLGIGTDLFGNASVRVLEASEIIGIRGMLVHAISPEAKSFYLAMGFEPSSVRPMTLILTLADIRAGWA